MGWKSIVGIVTRLWAGESGTQIPVGANFFSSPKQHWLACNILSNGHGGCFVSVKCPRQDECQVSEARWPLACIVQWLKMNGAVPLLPLYAFMGLTGKTLLFFFSLPKLIMKCEGRYTSDIVWQLIKCRECFSRSPFLEPWVCKLSWWL